MSIKSLSKDKVKKTAEVFPSVAVTADSRRFEGSLRSRSHTFPWESSQKVAFVAFVVLINDTQSVTFESAELFKPSVAKSLFSSSL